jgi:hypothetical protein
MIHLILTLISYAEKTANVYIYQYFEYQNTMRGGFFAIDVELK